MHSITRHFAPALRNGGEPAVGFAAQRCKRRKNFWSAEFLLPLPATQEWGEDRGEGHPLFCPTLPSTAWRRGSGWLRFCRAALYRRIASCHRGSVARIGRERH